MDEYSACFAYGPSSAIVSSGQAGLGIRCDSGFHEESRSPMRGDLQQGYMFPQEYNFSSPTDPLDFNGTMNFSTVDNVCSINNDDSTIIDSADSFLETDFNLYASSSDVPRIGPEIVPPSLLSSSEYFSSRVVRPPSIPRSPSESPVRFDSKRFTATPNSSKSGHMRDSAELTESLLYSSVESTCSPFDIPTPLSEFDSSGFSRHSFSPVQMPTYFPPPMMSQELKQCKPQHQQLIPGPYLLQQNTPHLPPRQKPVPLPPSPLKQVKHRRNTEARISMVHLYERMGLSSDPAEAGRRESCIMALLRGAGFQIGQKTWIRDTDEATRVRIIDEIFNATFEEFGYDKDLLELIVRRGAYYQMQRRLRQIRKRNKALAAKRL